MEHWPLVELVDSDALPFIKMVDMHAARSDILRRRLWSGTVSGYLPLTAQSKRRSGSTLMPSTWRRPLPEAKGETFPSASIWRISPSGPTNSRRDTGS
jgi:hypothetical protein